MKEGFCQVAGCGFLSLSPPWGWKWCWGALGSTQGGSSIRPEGNGSLGGGSFAAGEHPPDGVGETPGGIDSSDFGSPLLGESFHDVLMPVAVGGMPLVWVAASISAQRSHLGPCLVNGPLRSVSPDW